MKVLKFGALLFAAVAAFIFFGPREAVDRKVALAPIDIPQNIDEYLSEKEACFDDIIEDAQKQVIWAGKVGQKTEYSVLYLHGFSATSHEIRPVPENVAKTLGANLFYTRFAGHGRTGDAMLDATPEKWIQDAIEAVEIGARLGDKVIVLATSNGGAVASYLLSEPKYASKITGIVFTSPAYKLAHPATVMLDFPFVRYWGVLIAGKQHEFKVVNVDHAKYWTNSYPSLAVLPMTTLQRAVRKLDFGQINVPALFFVSDKDTVVNAKLIRQVASKWGGDSRLEARKMTAKDDPYKHILSGDILSPNQTAETVQIITKWVAGLQ